MPGGLARVDAAAGHRAPGRLPNASHKDVWVCARTSDSQPSALLLAQKVGLRRSDLKLASRTADNLFWLGRYMERAEGATRLFRTLLRHIDGELSLGQQAATLEKLGAVLVAHGQLSQRRARRLISLGRPGFASGLSSIIFDPDSEDSLSQVLGNIARTADAVRERLSSDMWRLIERLTQMPTHWQERPLHDALDAVSRLNTMVDSMAAINGMIAQNMTRADGWRFLEAGRHIERIRQISQLYRELTLRPDAPEQGALNLLLELSDCSITYRMRYGSSSQFVPVTDLVLADDTHPRSMLTQVVTLRRLLDALPRGDDEDGMPGAIDRTLLRLESALRLLDPAQIDTPQAHSGARPGVARLCRRADKDVESVTTRLTSDYFSHADPSRVSGLSDAL
ncbi:MAG: alpha-E domain-containing protein [Burkholderiaceae bacterium]